MKSVNAFVLITYTVSIICFTPSAIADYIPGSSMYSPADSSSMLSSSDNSDDDPSMFLPMENEDMETINRLAYSSDTYSEDSEGVDVGDESDETLYLESSTTEEGDVQIESPVSLSSNTILNADAPDATQSINATQDNGSSTAGPSSTASDLQDTTTDEAEPFVAIGTAASVTAGISGSAAGVMLSAHDFAMQNMQDDIDQADGDLPALQAISAGLTAEVIERMSGPNNMSTRPDLNALTLADISTNFLVQVLNRISQIQLAQQQAAHDAALENMNQIIMNADGDLNALNVLQQGFGDELVERSFGPNNQSTRPALNDLTSNDVATLLYDVNTMIDQINQAQQQAAHDAAIENINQIIMNAEGNLSELSSLFIVINDEINERDGGGNNPNTNPEFIDLITSDDLLAFGIQVSHMVNQINQAQQQAAHDAAIENINQIIMNAEGDLNQLSTMHTDLMSEYTERITSSQNDPNDPTTRPALNDLTVEDIMNFADQVGNMIADINDAQQQAAHDAAIENINQIIMNALLITDMTNLLSTLYGERDERLSGPNNESTNPGLNNLMASDISEAIETVVSNIVSNNYDQELVYQIDIINNLDGSYRTLQHNSDHILRRVVHYNADGDITALDFHDTEGNFTHQIAL